MKKLITLLYLLVFFFNSQLSLAQINDSLQLLLPISHEYGIVRLAFSDDLKHMATASSDGYVKIWDVRTNTLVYTLQPRTITQDGVGVGALCFTPDGRYLLSSLLTVDVWDIASGKRVKGLDTLAFGAFIYSIDVSADSKLAIDASGTRIKLWNMDSATLIREYKRPDFFTCVKLSKDGTTFLAGCNDSIVRLYDAHSDSILKEFCGSNGKIKAVNYSSDGSTIISATETTIYLWDRNSGKVIKTFPGYPLDNRSLSFTSGDSAILLAEHDKVRRINLKTDSSRVVFLHDDFFPVTFSKDTKRALYAYKEKRTINGATNSRMIDLGSGRTIKEFANRFKTIRKVKFSPRNSSLAVQVGNDQIRIIDLSNINKFRVIDSYFVSTFGFSNDENLFAYGYGGSGADSFAIVDLLTMANVSSFSIGGTATSVSFSADGKFLAIGLVSGRVVVIDLSTMSEIDSFTALTDVVVQVYFSVDNTEVVAVTAETIKARDIIRKRTHWSYPKDEPLDEQRFPSVDLKKWPTQAQGVINYFIRNHAIGRAEISGNGRSAIESQPFDFFKESDVVSGASLHRFAGHKGALTSASFSADNKYIATSAEDNTLKLWENGSGKLLATYLAIDSSSWFWIIPNNYYCASKDASKLISFKENNQIYRFNQFDLLLNRPDSVLKNIGHSPDSVISFYTRLVEKRMRENGITDTASPNLDVPDLTIVNIDTIPDLTTNPTIPLNIRSSDPLDSIKMINIWVNGVPIDNRSRGPAFKVPLLEGDNVIEVSSSNTHGRESLIETIQVKYDPPVKRKPNLYIVAIGVSEYKNYPEANLKYAAKDAEDLVKSFSLSPLYNKVYRYILTNKLAYRDTILKIKGQLMRSNVDDQVILSYSGHGVLNDSSNFYFCTSEVDTNKLRSTAVSFDEMEGLLDGIPSLKKLLLIDACYSGEIDRDAARELIRRSDTSKALHVGDAKAFVPVGGLSKTKQSVFDLVMESFVDLRRRTGSVVISSSSGVDLSYEKDQWENGLFTYAVISALNGNSVADLNGNGLYVSELTTYVTRLVEKLSLGLQIPTVREDNIDFDFRIW